MLEKRDKKYTLCG